jgi:hypothetical protein
MKSFKQILAWSFFRVLVGMLLLIILFGLVKMNQPHFNVYAEPSYGEQIAAKHECWNGGNGHPYPMHSVIIVNGTPAYVGHKTTDKALNSVLSGDGKYEVISFCK